VGLVLVIYEDDEDGDDIDEVAVGPYSDYNALREYIILELERGRPAQRFPTFIAPLSEEWSVADCYRLRDELKTITSEMSSRPALPFCSEWQRLAASEVGLCPQSAFESFVDPNARPVLGEIARLVEVAIRLNRPISFQ